MRLSFNSRALGLDLDAFASLEVAHASGFQSVDLLVRDLVESQAPLDALSQRMADLGLAPGAWPLPMNWRGSTPDFQRDLSLLPLYASAAAYLGLNVTATWVLPVWPWPSAEPSPDPVAWHRDRLGPIIEILSQHGITLALEVIGLPSARKGSGKPFLHLHSQLPLLLDALREPGRRLGILYDSFHLEASGESPEGLAELASAYPIAWVHLAELPPHPPADLSEVTDLDRLLPGTRPDAPTRSALAELLRLGFSGPVTIETFRVPTEYMHLPPVSYAQHLLQRIQPIWPVAPSRHRPGSIS